jgi:hypothetical protein
VQCDLSAFGQLMKRRSGPGAGIDRAGSGREIKKPAQPHSFGGR